MKTAKNNGSQNSHSRVKNLNAHALVPISAGVTGLNVTFNAVAPMVEGKEYGDAVMPNHQHCYYIQARSVSDIKPDFLVEAVYSGSIALEFDYYLERVLKIDLVVKDKSCDDDEAVEMVKLESEGLTIAMQALVPPNKNAKFLASSIMLVINQAINHLKEASVLK